MKFIKLGLFFLLILFLSNCFIFDSESNTSGNPDSYYSPEFGLHIDGFEILFEYHSVEEFINEVKLRGYSILLVNIIPDRYYFYSPTLKSLNYEEGENVLSDLVRYCEENSIKLYIDIQSLAWKKREVESDWIKGDIPEKEDMISIIDELLKYNIDGISEELFPMDWILAAGEKCKENKLEYIHKSIDFIIEEPYQINKNFFSVSKNTDIFMSMDYYFNDSIITTNFFSGAARGLNKRYWMKSTPENWGQSGYGPGSVRGMEKIIYFKTVLAQPEYIFVMVRKRGDFEKVFPKEIKSRIESFKILENENLFNLVFYLSNQPDIDDDNPADTSAARSFVLSCPAILNAISSGGYKLHISQLPVESSDYYVFTRGGYWDNLNTLELPGEITELLNKNNLLFFQTGGVLPGPVSTHWENLRNYFNLDSTEFYYFDNTDTDLFLPEFSIFDNIEYRHFRHKAWECAAAGIFENNWNNADVISSGDTREGKIASIIKKTNKYFINGNSLDFESYYVLAKLIKTPLIKYFNGYFTFSGNTYAAFSMGDTELNFLPDISNETNFKIYKITTNDMVSEYEMQVIPGNQILIEMKKWEMVIIYKL